MKIFDNLIFSTVLILTAILSAQDFEDLYFGTDSTFEILTWNIEWFPKNGQTTVDYVTAIIQALDVDVLAIQEVDDTDMFDQMLENLLTMKDIMNPPGSPAWHISTKQM